MHILTYGKTLYPTIYVLDVSNKICKAQEPVREIGQRRPVKA